MGERLAFTFALTGRRDWEHGTQGVALGYGLAGLSARAGPQTRLFRTISTYLIFLDFEHSTFRGGCGTATRGAARTCDEALGRSTVAHFARKVRGANIAAAKHELKIQ